MSKKLAAVRIRGVMNVNAKIRDTLNMLGLKRRFSAAVIEDTPSARGMLKKCHGYITWGEADDDTVEIIKKKGLSPPKGGLKSAKHTPPEGDLGYRGSRINEFVKKMAW